MTLKIKTLRKPAYFAALGTLALSLSACASTGSKDYGNFGTKAGNPVSTTAQPQYPNQGYPAQQSYPAQGYPQGSYPAQYPAPNYQQPVPVPVPQQPQTPSYQGIPSQSYGAVSDTPVVLGQPYQVDGKTYTPGDDPTYDDAGYASWYGAELAGRKTANGEMFNPNGVSAAHRTLPLPSYVEVTNLDNGKTILVRVNDRGPFVSNRLIDLSYGAAAQLGIVEQGVAAVRVRRVSPPEADRSVLRSGQPAAQRIDTPESLLAILRKKVMGQPVPGSANGQMPGQGYAQSAPAPQAPSYGQSGYGSSNNTPGADYSQSGSTGYVPSAPARQTSGSGVSKVPVTAASTSGYVVQIGAFSSKSRAQSVASKTGAHLEQAGNLWRVRIGPFPSKSAATPSLNKVHGQGYGDARILSSE